MSFKTYIFLLIITNSVECKRTLRYRKGYRYLQDIPAAPSSVIVDPTVPGLGIFGFFFFDKWKIESTFLLHRCSNYRYSWSVRWYWSSDTHTWTSVTPISGANPLKLCVFRAYSQFLDWCTNTRFRYGFILIYSPYHLMNGYYLQMTRRSYFASNGGAYTNRFFNPWTNIYFYKLGDSNTTTFWGSQKIDIILCISVNLLRIFTKYCCSVFR